MLVSPLVARVAVFEAYTMFGFPAHLDVDVTLIAPFATTTEVRGVAAPVAPARC
jgi:hypothetical protein